MPFMVIYSTSDGTSCHQQADAIDEAALLVERLRNKDGIEDNIRIYRMEEISFAFRPYYKVELGMPERQAAPVSGVATPPVAALVEAPAAVVEPAPVVDVPPAPAEVTVEASTPMHATADGELGPNGRRGLFGR